MILNDHDKVILKWSGISEDEFKKLDNEEQIKTMKKGYDNYIKSRGKSDNSKLFENATKVFPKIKEVLAESPEVYVSKMGVSTGMVEALIVGYIAKEKKILTIRKDTKADKITVFQVNESDLIEKADV